jgi:ketosteroid isomerase-like protein
MYASAVRFMIRRSVRRINAGDIRPTLNSFADDATLVFPGDHSWGGEYKGKPAIEGFLRRFVGAGLQIVPEEIVVAGLPWNTRVCMRFTNEARDPDSGAVVYANRGIIYARAVWGKITYQEDYEDTQRVVEFDSYLAARGLLPGGTLATPEGPP